MKLKKLLALSLICLSTTSHAFSASRTITDVLMLRPTTIPSGGVNGEVRHDTSDNNLKIFKGSTWALLEATQGTFDVETISSVDTLDAVNAVVLLDSSGGAFSLNLPTAIGIEGKVYDLKLVLTGNAVTVDPFDSQTIDGLSTVDLDRLDERLKIVSDNANWKILNRDRIERSQIRLHTFNTFGSTASNTIPRYTTVVENVGVAITYTDSVADGNSFTINEVGTYSFSVSWAGVSSGTTLVGFSLNSSQLTTGVQAITTADRLNYTSIDAKAGSTNVVHVSWEGALVVNDVVRVHGIRLTPNVGLNGGHSVTATKVTD